MQICNNMTVKNIHLQTDGLISESDWITTISHSPSRLARCRGRGETLKANAAELEI